MAYTVGGIIALALAYNAMAYLGLILAVPPGYATVFWPASGVALAAIYLFGNRLLPGVFLGYAIANFLYFFSYNYADTYFDILLNPGVPALGATLQAFVGAALLKRFVGERTPLVTLKDNARLAFFAGPLSSLISCSIAVCVLYSIGSISAQSLPFTWATWYVGDALGIMVFTPLLILVFNKDVSLYRKVVTAIPLLILFALVITLFFVFKKIDQVKRVDEFEDNVSLMQQELDQHFKAYLRDLDTYISFYKSSEEVTPDEFEEFSDHMFPSLQDARAIGWAHQATRESLPALLERYGQEGFQYRRYEEGKGFVPADPAPEEHLMPVLLSYSKALSSDAIGIDLYTHPDRRSAIERAIISGDAQMTEPIWLVGKKGGKGFLLFGPLYDEDEGLAHQGERVNNFRSVVILVYQYDTIFNSVVQNWDNRGIQINVYDMDDEEVPLYASAPESLAKDIKDLQIFKEIPYKFLGRTLYFQFFIDADYSVSNTTWSIWYALVLSLAFTFISSIFLLVLTGQTALVEGLVRQKTQELAERNSFLRLIMDNVPDFVFVKNHRYEIVDANKSFLKIFAPEKRKTLLGKTGLEQFPQKDWEGYLENDKKAFREGYSETEENVTNYHGVMSTLVTKKVRFEDAQGQPFILGIARDVTDFLTVQKKLQTILNTTADGLVTISHDGAIETFNITCEKIFGYDADEVIGENVSLLMSTDDALLYRENIDKFKERMQNEASTDGREMRGMRSDGTTFPMYLAVAEVEVGGRVMYSGIIRDITREKEMIEQLQASRRELEKSNKELEQFAYVASHDLKAPLRHVTLSAGFLKENYGPKLDKNAQKFLNVMEESSDRMQQMIDSLLEYSRVGRGDKKDLEDVDLKKVVGDVKETLSEVIEARDVKITTRGLPIMQANRILMLQLFQNLIQNAIKYCEPEVKPCINIQAKQLEDVWELSIADNGIGIAPEYANKIFMVFQRLHRDGEYEGTGIGLSICQRIVEFHGGNIELDLNYKGGARFIITLPVKGA